MKTTTSLDTTSLDTSTDSLDASLDARELTSYITRTVKLTSIVADWEPVIVTSKLNMMLLFRVRRAKSLASKPN